jgi:hypothetical protein
MKKLTNPCDFVGRFFFSFKNDELQWQGRIISKVSEGVFLVQLHEWTTGESSSQVLFSVQDMMGWKFYDTAEAWRSALATPQLLRTRCTSLHYYFRDAGARRMPRLSECRMNDKTRPCDYARESLTISGSGEVSGDAKHT